MLLGMGSSMLCKLCYSLPLQILDYMRRYIVYPIPPQLHLRSMPNQAHLKQYILMCEHLM